MLEAAPQLLPRERFSPLALFGRRPPARVESLSCRRPKTCAQRTHALQQNKTSAWSLSPARKADVTSYPSCQWDVPDSRSLQWAASVPSAGELSNSKFVLQNLFWEKTHETSPPKKILP